jgi:hypothetical protein
MTGNDHEVTQRRGETVLFHPPKFKTSSAVRAACAATTDRHIVQYVEHFNVRVILTPDGLLRFNVPQSPRFASSQAMAALWCRQQHQSGRR